MSTSSNTERSRPLAIVSYNILADAYIKPGRYDHVAPEALEPTARRALLLRRLAALEADIYCLQEVEPDAYEAILGHLGEGFAGDYVQKVDRPDGCATFVQKEVATILEREPMRTSFEGAPQVASILHLSWAGRRLSVANTHLRWQPEHTPLEKHPGHLHLLELLALREKHPESTWILAGDLNASSQSRIIQTAEARGLALSCRSQRPWDTTNINGRRRKLDYLLYEPSALTPRPGALPRLERETPMPSAVEPSDHLPLYVQFFA